MAAAARPSFFDKYEFLKVAGAGAGACNFSCLGSGGFGAVFECVARGSAGPALAVKQIYTSEKAAMKMFDAEVTRMLALRARILADAEVAATVIVLADGFLEENSTGGIIIRLVMERSPIATPFPIPCKAHEFQPDPALFRKMESMGSGCDMTSNGIAQPPLTLTQSRHVMRQLLTAIKFFHDNDMIHRDVKPDNLLVWGSAADAATGETFPLIKLSDFGLARAVDPLADKYTSNVGTKSYRAPELLTGVYDSRVDLFSAGCTFFALLLAVQPSDNVGAGFPDRFQHISPARLLSVFPFDSPQLHFLAMLTQKESASRLTAAAALAHPFLSAPVP